MKTPIIYLLWDFKGECIMKKSIIIGSSVIAVVALLIGGFFLFNNKEEKKELKLQSTDEIKSMVDSIYANIDIDLPELETTVIDPIDEMQLTTFTGLQSTDNVESLVVSVPLMNAQAYSLAVVKVSEDADVEAMKKEMLDNIDMRRWICVSAEKLMITNYENIIFLIMTSENEAKSIYDAFKKYVENDIGKELEKDEEIDFDF